jgi:hypothetical protein
MAENKSFKFGNMSIMIIFLGLVYASAAYQPLNGTIWIESSDQLKKSISRIGRNYAQ